MCVLDLKLPAIKHDITPTPKQQRNAACCKDKKKFINSCKKTGQDSRPTSIGLKGKLAHVPAGYRRIAALGIGA
jgi:hypothetical protein